jgi:hypothetical protein
MELVEANDRRFNDQAEWIRSRINWLLVSQAFLLTTLAVAFTSQYNQDLLKTIAWVVAFLGLIHSLLIVFAASSAVACLNVSLQVRKEYDKLIRAKVGNELWAPLGIDRSENDSGCVRFSLCLGYAANYGIPISLVLGWIVIMLLMSNFGIYAGVY